MDAAATKLRTFIAIDLPDAVRQAVRAYQAQVQRDLAAAEVPSVFRWSAVDTIHLTLRFLGDTTPAQCEAVAARLRSQAAGWQPFTLQVGTLGGFPNLRRPRVLWLGVNGDSETLAQVQAAVEAAVVDVGFEPEPKSFRPHLTLARTRREAPSRAVQAAGAALQERSAGEPSGDATPSFPVTELIHYRSELRRSGSIYTPLTVIPFG